MPVVYTTTDPVTSGEIDTVIAELYALRLETVIAALEEDFTDVPTTTDTFDDTKDVGMWKTIVTLLNSGSLLKMISGEDGTVRYFHEQDDGSTLSIYSDQVAYITDDNYLNNDIATDVFMNAENTFSVYSGTAAEFFAYHGKTMYTE